jgi:hypothetical protein
MTVTVGGYVESTVITVITVIAAEAPRRAVHFSAGDSPRP